MVAWKNLTMENITDGKTLETKISRLKKHEQNLSFIVALGNVNEKKHLNQLLLMLTLT